MNIKNNKNKTHFSGAFFLQSLATQLNLLMQKDSIKVEDKELDNIVLLLCCLYAFKVSEIIILIT